VEDPALDRRERLARQLLESRDGGAELRQVALDHRRHQPREHDLRHLGGVAGAERQTAEGLLLRMAGEPGRRRRDHDDAAPLLGQREAREQRAGSAPAAGDAALDDEPALRERPQPDRRATPAADRCRQLRGLDLTAVERRERAAHRQRELRAGPEPDVRRHRPQDAQPRAGRQPEHGLCAPREAEHALGVGRVRHPLPGGLGLDDELGLGDRDPDAAEAPRPAVAEVEDPEVQPGGSVHAHRRHRAPSLA
jgi:hypothetical protein